MPVVFPGWHMGNRNFNVEGPDVPAPRRGALVLDKRSIHRAARYRATRMDERNFKELCSSGLRVRTTNRKNVACRPEEPTNCETADPLLRSSESAKNRAIQIAEGSPITRDSSVPSTSTATTSDNASSSSSTAEAAPDNEAAPGSPTAIAAAAVSTE